MSDQQAAKTVAQFCETNGFSRATLYNMFKAGTGPDVIRVGKGKKLLISSEAERRWKVANERAWGARGKASA